MSIASTEESAANSVPFAIKDCALVSLATGKRARTLPALRGELNIIQSASIYHHFWGGLLEARFEEREYNNDFASWVRHGIHDAVLAERLAALDPTNCQDLESLRNELVDLVDSRLDEAEHLHWIGASYQFEFICSQIVVFDTKRQLQQPAELVDAITDLATSSIFYHFIDARRRTADRRDDFSEWLSAWGTEFEPLNESLANIDPWFSNLSELRNTLSYLFRDFFSKAAS